MSENQTRTEVTPINKTRKPSRLIWLLLCVVLIIGGVLAHYAYTQRKRLAESDKKVISLQSENQSLTATLQTQAVNPATNGSLASYYNALVYGYNSMLEKARTPESDEETAIIQTLTDYYKLPTNNQLNAKVLVIYNTSTSDKPNNDDKALIYIPPTNSKSAGFIETVKPKQGGAWKVDEQL